MKGEGIDDANEADFLRALLRNEVRVVNIWETHAVRLEKKGLVKQEGRAFWVLAVSREEAEAAIAVGMLGRDR